MGSCGFITALAVLSIITLEGLNGTLATDATKGATQFLTWLTTNYKIDTRSILPYIPHLKMVALTALTSVVIRPLAIFPALYLIITRFVTINSKFWTFVGNTQKGFPDALNKSADDLTYILTTVAFVGVLFSYTWGSGSTQKNAPRHAHK